MARQKLTRAEEILFVLQKYAGHTPENAKSIRELLDLAGISLIRSHMTATAFIWRCLGTGDGSTGLIARVKDGQTYRYYKPSHHIDQMDFPNLVAAYRAWDEPIFRIFRQVNIEIPKNQLRHIMRVQAR